MKFESTGDCVGRSCGYGLYEGSLGCDSGPGSCWEAKILEADESAFHDSDLQEATRKIKDAINAVPADAEGRKLSFIHTHEGTMLAWVHHGVRFPAGTLTVDSDAAELRRGLGIADSRKPEESN